MQESKGFAQYIDDLRASRNISREDFVSGVISLRQYYRYIKGENALKDETLIKLLDKLELNLIEVHTKYLRNHNSITKNLNKVYNCFQLSQYHKANRLLNGIDIKSTTSRSTRKFYNYLKLSISYYLNEDNKMNTIEEIIKLINYPKILEKDILTFYELNALIFITDYLIKYHNDYKVVEYTYDILMKKENIFLSDKSPYLLALYSLSVKHLGKIGEFEKSINIAKIGIEKSKKYGYFNNLPSILYYKAISEKNINEMDCAKSTLIQLFSILKVLDVDKKTKTFKKSIKKIFDLEENDLIKYLY